jgi:SAM-dependent methyltransferase
MNDTLKYYEINASDFSKSTVKVDFSEVQDKFLELIPKGGTMLDYGCGAGRDTKAFLEKGYRVEAVDGSEKLCKIAGEYTGIEVKQMLFNELDEVNKYDGIWACASILHLPKDELRTVLKKMIRAVKPGGYIYASFKYGEFEGDRNGRYFTDFTKNTFKQFIQDFAEVRIEEMWISVDVRPGRGDEKWLNVIMQRSAIN